ncbi:hypothetical protein Kpol_1043p22 [Vanderwaltozyma polyspora DSM 70294]|uniref:DNA mismatch repair protein S5 domain-containing protein n=1 Tax=Vanderwaltozyma polyspora (strain ATCC 22028 / DSM 70294 / BCRC 21397 / CBS 2163 / NBRC 10782 / NRRL Y-8283 / UCD 57-17) TaxID=436907 RepID=A7TIP0_VANPO|nr:uncharacterized protein Kpol_1043p22 [Vanderwaltozyma polyspora DSM 70294]EDO17832.1 hypothetical protein Kpol_1043p22 [Vanderwaltozyma polyspora DSM 70294]
MVAKIKALDPSVVNKIAAGEIIISPVNALKEMMENSIDAGCSSIDILVKDGGIKVLQITDNGSGIEKDDLPILCERFTTSKLSKFEDLGNIETYGFRGEALASISHISRVTVTTKTKNDQCAWKVSYSEGKMLGQPKPVAGRDGTVILVEDLFYNIPSRLRSLRSPSDEYSKILDVVGRYAVHSKDIGFSCKKMGDSNFTLTVRANLTIQERIRTVFGNNVSSHLIDYELPEIEDIGVKRIDGQVTDLNFQMKKSIQPIFFINNRLVTCDPLRRSLNQVFGTYLSKGFKAFIYLNILIDPQSVDVNVHPTKREVRFLNQDEIIEKINFHLNDELSKLNTSRTFKTSTLLTGQPVEVTVVSNSQNSNASRPVRSQSQLQQIKNKIYEHKLVRTDSSQSKITSFMKPPTERDTQTFNTANIPKKRLRSTFEESETVDIDDETVSSSTTTQVVEEISNDDNEVNDENSITGDGIITNGYKIVPRKRTSVDLTSILKLRENVDNTAHRELTNIFANLTFVGVVDEQKRLAAIQHDLKLFLVDYGAVSFELFYQIGLTDFANFGIIQLKTEDKKDLQLFEILSSIDIISKDEKSIMQIIQKFWEMKDMLKEYFSIEFSNDGDDLRTVELSSIPLLLKDYHPPMSKLSFFLFRLGTKVNWESEEECLSSILKQIALFYIPEIIEKMDTTDEMSEDLKIEYINKKNYINSSLENIIFPCVKRRLLAPSSLLKDVIEIANLPGLYKVFERC